MANHEDDLIEEVFEEGTTSKKQRRSIANRLKKVKGVDKKEGNGISKDKEQEDEFLEIIDEEELSMTAKLTVATTELESIDFKESYFHLTEEVSKREAELALSRDEIKEAEKKFEDKQKELDKQIEKYKLQEEVVVVQQRKVNEQERIIKELETKIKHHEKMEDNYEEVITTQQVNAVEFEKQIKALEQVLSNTDTKHKALQDRLTAQLRLNSTLAEENQRQQEILGMDNPLTDNEAMEKIKRLNRIEILMEELLNTVSKHPVVYKEYENTIKRMAPKIREMEKKDNTSQKRR